MGLPTDEARAVNQVKAVAPFTPHCCGKVVPNGNLMPKLLAQNMGKAPLADPPVVEQVTDGPLRPDQGLDCRFNS